MGFYNTLIQDESLKELNKKGLWRYMLSEVEFDELRKALQFANPDFIDSRDATLWYAFWWQRCYSGGSPSKEQVFRDLGGNLTYLIDSQRFYEIAKEGAERIGIKWLKGQVNFLRFKTMLLQGGLPIQHMDNNASAYSDFLLAAVDAQPQTIDDIKINPDLYLKLPSTSQNDIIYSNCLEIVQSILNNEDSPYDSLLKTRENLKALTNQLRIRHNSATNIRSKKAKVFWLMDKNYEKVKIFLHLGFASKYRKSQNTENTHELFNILGFDPVSAVYPLYINDIMIVQFVRTTNGDYKTEWVSKNRIYWNNNQNSLEIYTYLNNSKKALNEIIQNEPDITNPSLWVPYENNLWRLVKGSACSADNAAVLINKDWITLNDKTALTIEGENLYWVPFEGELSVNKNNNDTWCFKSNVSAFDWNIKSNRPDWMTTSTVVVTRSLPRVYIFNASGDRIKRKVIIKYKPWGSQENWIEHDLRNRISVGRYELKINYDGIVAYDSFYNIGDLKYNIHESTLHTAKIDFEDLNQLTIRIDEDNLLNVVLQDSIYSLNVPSEARALPVRIMVRIKVGNQKSLSCSVLTPFSGVAVIDPSGNIVDDGSKLFFNDLQGYRIMGNSYKETIINLNSTLNRDVTISREIKKELKPLDELKKYILPLFHLADVMDHRNEVKFTLQSGREQQSFTVAPFTHHIIVGQGCIETFEVEGSGNIPNFVAIPLNCTAEEIEPVQVISNSEKFEIPNINYTQQWVIVSKETQGIQVMPRFVNSSQHFTLTSSEDRIKTYHDKIIAQSYNEPIWKEINRYFHICQQYNIPYSTFDQLRALQVSQTAAIKGFFYLGFNDESENFIPQTIEALERDLGLSFHWASLETWQEIYFEIDKFYDNKYSSLFYNSMIDYFRFSNLEWFENFINGDSLSKVYIGNQEIRKLRQALGNRVMNELPTRGAHCNNKYGIPVKEHMSAQFMIFNSIAAAESILGKTDHKLNLWGQNYGNAIVRRGVQYTQFLCSDIESDFYSKTIQHVLTHQ